MFESSCRFQPSGQTVNVPSSASEATIVNFTLQRSNDDTIPTSEKLVASTTLSPPLLLNNQNSLSDQLEDLLKNKVKQAPNLLCLYRYVIS